MFSPQRVKFDVAIGVATGVLLFSGFGRPAFPQSDNSSTDTATMTVVVKEYDTGEPISQAHVTLQFGVPHSQLIPNKKAKPIYYNAKTDAQGRCRFSEINKGPIVLSVTASGHQTYGKELELEKDGQVFEVRLKKPQPLT